MSLPTVLSYHFALHPHPQSPTTVLVGQPFAGTEAVPVIFFPREHPVLRFSNVTTPMVQVNLVFRSADSSVVTPPPSLGSTSQPVYLVPLTHLWCNVNSPIWIPHTNPVGFLGPLPPAVHFLGPPPVDFFVHGPSAGPQLHVPLPLPPPVWADRPPTILPPLSDRQVLAKFVDDGITYDEFAHHFRWVLMRLRQLNMEFINVNHSIEDIRFEERYKWAIVTFSAPEPVQLFFFYNSNEALREVNNKQYYVYPYSFWLETQYERRACIIFDDERVPTEEQIRTHFNQQEPILDAVMFERPEGQQRPLRADLFFYTTDAVRQLLPNIQRPITVHGIALTLRRYFARTD